jgi:hypothetical protein
MIINISVLRKVKMEVAVSSETSVNEYQATRCHILEDNNLQVKRSLETNTEPGHV